MSTVAHLVSRQTAAPDAGDVITQALQSAFDKESGTTSVAVGSQFALMIVLSLVCLVFFSILRPRNSRVYEPKRKYASPAKAPPQLGKGLLDWILPILRIKDKEVLEKIGLDAFAFLRLIKMCQSIFLCSATVSCAVLIPVNLIYNLKQSGTDRPTGLSLVTIENVQDPYLWAHIVITYVVTFIALFFIWRYYRETVKLRWDFFRSDEFQNSLYARTVMITDLPKRLQSDDGVNSIFRELQVPYHTSSTHVARTVQDLPELIEKHNTTVAALEAQLAAYVKNPEKLPANRPTVQLGGHACCGGRKVDAIDYYTKRIAELETEFEDARDRIADRKTINYGFASFQCIPHAHVVAKRLRGKKPKGTWIGQAPHPRDILWKNLALTRAARRTTRFFGWIIFVAVCIAFIVPLIVLAALANLSLLAQAVTGLRNWQNSSPTTFSIFAGVVPPALQGILTFFLPLIMRKISKRQGCTTYSGLDRAVTAKYYFFLMVNYLIIFTLFKVIWYLVAQVLIVNISQGQSASSILNQLRQQGINKTRDALVQNSNYWLTYLALRYFSVFFDQTQLLNLILIWIRTRAFGRTPRDIVEWTKPPDFEYPLYASINLFLAAIVFCYVVIAPLVGLVGALLFVVSGFVFKYQLLYVFGSRVETGGLLWRVLVNRLLVGILFMHLAMLLCFAIHESWSKLFALLPPILITLAFKLYLRRAFDTKMRYYLPDEGEMKSVRMHLNDASRHRLASRFGHPALTEELWTPMVHAKARHLLPQIYKGRLDPTLSYDSKTGYDEEANKVETFGGLAIESVEPAELEYDPVRWRQEHGQADDARSVTTAATGATTPYPASLGHRPESAASSYHMRDYFSTPSPPQYSSPRGHDHFGPVYGARTPDEGYYPATQDPRKESRVRLVDQDVVSAEWAPPRAQSRGAGAQVYHDPYRSPPLRDDGYHDDPYQPRIQLHDEPYESASAYAYPPAQPRGYTAPLVNASPPSTLASRQLRSSLQASEMDRSELDRRRRQRPQGAAFFAMQ